MNEDGEMSKTMENLTTRVWVALHFTSSTGISCHLLPNLLFRQGYGFFDRARRVDRAIEKTVTLRACRRIDGLLEI